MNGIDHTDTDSIVCPYCGEEHHPDRNLDDLGEEYTCDDCDRTFMVQPDCTVTYTSWTMEYQLQRKIRWAERNQKYWKSKGNIDEAAKYAAEAEQYRAWLEKLQEATA